MFFGEVTLFYNMLYTPTSMFSNTASIDIKTIVYSAFFSTAHLLVTGAIIFLLFLSTNQSIYKYMLFSLTGETNDKIK